MGILESVADALDPGRKWARRAEQTEDSGQERAIVPGSAFPVAPTTAGPNSIQRSTWKQPPQRGTADLLAAFSASPPFRAVVDRVVQAFARVPFYVHTEPDQKDYKNEPILQLMQNYNPQIVGAKGRRLEQTYLEVTGEVFTIIMPTRHEKLIDLYPVPPTWVTVESKAGRPHFCVNINGHQHEFEQHEVLHRKVLELNNPYGRGRGGGWTVADEIEADEYVQKHAKSYFYNSTTPEFIAQIKGSEKQRRQMEDAFMRKHRGFQKSWQPHFTNAEIEITELTRKLGDERIEDLRRYWADVIRWVYGIPPEIIGMVDNSNRATIQEARQIMGEFVTDPRCVDYQDDWLYHIAPIFGSPDLRYDSPIPRTFDRRDEIMSRHPYAFTRNEIRREAGFDEVPDGDEYPVPTNIESQPAQRSFAEAGHKTAFRLIDCEAPQ